MVSAVLPIDQDGANKHVNRIAVSNIATIRLPVFMVLPPNYANKFLFSSCIVSVIVV